MRTMRSAHGWIGCPRFWVIKTASSYQPAISRADDFILQNNLSEMTTRSLSESRSRMECFRNELHLRNSAKVEHRVGDGQLFNVYRLSSSSVPSDCTTLWPGLSVSISRSFKRDHWKSACRNMLKILTTER